MTSIDSPYSLASIFNPMAVNAEKAKLNLENGALRFKLDTLVAAKDNLKAEYEVELKAVAENLKKAGDQKRTTEATQKFVEDRTFTTETAVAKANSNFKTVVAKKDKQLAKAKEEMEKVNLEWVEAYDEAKGVMAFKKEFSNTLEYLRLANLFITAGGE
ncbi:hypothetical protein Adt_32524 [Abeliophyllum distichum]|uniref:Uncharacterized protein n=1 Tax=Abeliophyllum distichum TaxID=126358 RepID=A0ABD1QVM1_9LAMI